jgi:hypothetical protein
VVARVIGDRRAARHAMRDVVTSETGGGEMAAIVLKDDAKATRLTGRTGLRARAGEMVQRAMAYVAAVVLICAVGAAVFQLAVQILGFPAPIAVTAITLIAAALLNSLRRHLRAQASTRAARGASYPTGRSYGGRPHGAGTGAGNGRVSAETWEVAADLPTDAVESARALGLLAPAHARARLASSAPP